METTRTDEILEQIKIDKEFIGYAEYGLGFRHSIAQQECKVFLSEDNINVYSLKPNLAQIKEVNNKEILNIKVDWTTKREKIEEGSSAFWRGLIGFLCFDYVGMAIGILSAKEPVYIDVNVYHVKIKTTRGDLSFILEELPKSGKLVL